LKKLHPDWRTLVVCYNISLSRYLKRLLELSGTEEGHADIEVYHFHALVRRLTGVDVSPWPGEKGEQYDPRIGAILKGEIAKGTVKRGCYDAILVDEGQDFTTDWMQGLTQLLNEDHDSLLFCYDPAQNVFGRLRPNWKTAGFKVQGKRPTELKRSYRNTVEILEVAKRFAKLENLDVASDEESLDLVLFPISTNRHGPKPILQACSTIGDQVNYVVESIGAYLQSEDCTRSDIGILYTDRLFHEFPVLLKQAFEKRFGQGGLVWVKERQDKLNLDLGHDSVKLLTIHSCKGLEFKVVFLVGLESMPRFTQSEEDERKLAYVGLTRAQDVLHIPYQSQNAFIGELEEIIQALPEKAL
jgi:superfamily I DNA/RNA helicase